MRNDRDDQFERSRAEKGFYIAVAVCFGLLIVAFVYSYRLFSDVVMIPRPGPRAACARGGD